MGRYIERRLLTAASATGEPVAWSGWRGAFMVEGTFGAGAKVTLQYKMPNGTWIDVDSTSGALTANGMFGFECPPGELQADVAGTASNLNAWVITTDET